MNDANKGAQLLPTRNRFNRLNSNLEVYIACEINILALHVRQELRRPRNTYESVEISVRRVARNLLTRDQLKILSSVSRNAKINDTWKLITNWTNKTLI